MPVTLRLSESTEKRLNHLAHITGRSKSYYLRQALEEKLDELEDIYISEMRLEKPEGPRWTLDQLEKGDDLER